MKMSLPIEHIKELSAEMQEVLKPFGMKAINLNDEMEMTNTLDHMRQIFGLDDDIYDFFVKEGPDEERQERLKKLYRLDLDNFVKEYNAAWQDASGSAHIWWVPSCAKKLSFWGELKMIPDLISITGWRKSSLAFKILLEMERWKPKEPHWYIGNVACKSDQRGKHLPSALIVLGLLMVDIEKVPCVLFISDPKKEVYYNRFGFHLIPESFSGPKFSNTPFYKAMIRPAQDIPMTVEEVKKLLGK